MNFKVKIFLNSNSESVKFCNDSNSIQNLNSCALQDGVKVANSISRVWCLCVFQNMIFLYLCISPYVGRPVGSFSQCKCRSATNWTNEAAGAFASRSRTSVALRCASSVPVHWNKKKKEKKIKKLYVMSLAWNPIGVICYRITRLLGSPIAR